MTNWVDFDQLIYLQLDHAPGYSQWWVMLNLGLAKSPDGKDSAIIIQRFASRELAEEYKGNIYHDCIKHEHPHKHPSLDQKEIINKTIDALKKEFIQTQNSDDDNPQ